MTFALIRKTLARTVMISFLGSAAPFVMAGQADAQLSPYVQALAEAASEQDVVAAFYAQRDYAPVWTGAADAERRAALLDALSRAGDHGLPVQRYDAQALRAAFMAAQTEGDRGRLEARMMRAYLDYARDLQSGVLVPAKVDRGIVREVVVRDTSSHLAAISGPFDRYLRGLAPDAPAYAQLMKAKLTLQAQIARGGWGDAISATALKPGQSGDAVVALRNRLIAMGYLRRTATRDFDGDIQKAVQQFQLNHGLEASGNASEATIAELNIGPETRLEAVIVAMERERWLNGLERGRRHIWVNLTDFTAKIIDDGKVTFSTRSVIGKDVPDQRSPEFSDEMEYMVINPSWNVPRSITTKEYLPLLKKNPNAAGHLKIVDSKGRVVSRGAINFGNYTAANFPFSMRQPPSDGNALGLVKFMFPNPWNIYLHDTPSKSLFDREVRAFSHGCIRLGDPFDFAYALLAKQSDDPKAEFHRVLDTGTEAAVQLDTHVPVHIVYFTAFPSPKGQMNYRRDVYGRDGVIFDALKDAGVVLDAHQG